MSFDKGLNLIAGRPGTGKSNELHRYIKSSMLTMNKSILYSLETSKHILEEKYNIKESNMLTIIDKETSIDDIEDIIENYNIICIDYMNLLQSDIDTHDDKIIRLKELADVYHKCIIVIDIIGINEDETKYEDNIYKNCDSIYLVKDGEINRIK